MKLSDLNKVNRLIENLNKSTSHHLMLKNILSGSIYKGSSIPHSVRIEIGGDCHGNGRYKTVTANIQDVEFVVRLLDREISEEWGKIVSIRSKLRELGVNIDGASGK